jgi:class 3 adenylate cyclase
MADEGFKRKLAVILSADVEGYSRFMDTDMEAMILFSTTVSFRKIIGGHSDEMPKVSI